MEHHRISALVLVVALVVGACGDGGEAADPTTSSDAPVPTESTATSTPDTSVLGGETTSTLASPASDRPVAPDFTLDLGDGGSYTLSEGSKPVYLVFWAEW